MKRKVLLFRMAMLSIDVYGQQIAEIDLVSYKLPKYETQSMDLDGCSTPFYPHSDGVIVDTERRSKLKLELTLSKETVHRGEIVNAQILMQNVGLDAIVIPWSLDPEIRKHPSGTVQHEYELGWFELELKGRGKIRIPLESESESAFLNSSESNPQSRLRLEPGQWVTAKIRFVLKEKEKLSVLEPVKSGTNEISVRWRQARYTWRRDGCTIETGYFSYDYEQDTRPLGIEIVE